jgi:serine/threonine-protein kinase
VPAEQRPAHIGVYTTVRTIADGGLATVFEAIDPHCGSAVAIKIVKPGLAKPDDAAQRLEREGALLRRFRSKRILQVLDAGRHRGRPFLVLELASGGSLSPRLVAGAERDPWTMARIIDQAADAVAELHRQQVLHRDIHPGNLLITGSPGCSAGTRTGRLLDEVEDLTLGDLDIAVDLSDGPETPWQACGTPRFRAPEQITPGNPCTPATDIYGLTAVAWVLASGSSPPLPDQLAEALASIPDWWAAVIGTGMAARPGDRFGDVAAWHRAVRQAIDTDLDRAGHAPLP